MEIENTKEATIIELKNNRVFIGVYLVPLFTLIGLIISKITIYSILMCLTIFIFLNIENYIAIRNIGSIETLTLNTIVSMGKTISFTHLTMALSISCTAMVSLVLP